MDIQHVPGGVRPIIFTYLDPPEILQVLKTSRDASSMMSNRQENEATRNTEIWKIHLQAKYPTLFDVMQRIELPAEKYQDVAMFAYRHLKLSVYQILNRSFVQETDAMNRIYDIVKDSPKGYTGIARVAMILKLFAIYLILKRHYSTVVKKNDIYVYLERYLQDNSYISTITDIMQNNEYSLDPEDDSADPNEYNKINLYVIREYRIRYVYMVLNMDMRTTILYLVGTRDEVIRDVFFRPIRKLIPMILLSDNDITLLSKIPREELQSVIVYDNPNFDVKSYDSVVKIAIEFYSNPADLDVKNNIAILQTRTDLLHAFLIQSGMNNNNNLLLLREFRDIMNRFRDIEYPRNYAGVYIMNKCSNSKCENEAILHCKDCVEELKMYCSEECFQIEHFI